MINETHRPITSRVANIFRRENLPPPPVFVVQPILNRIVNRVAQENPDIFNRLGPHRSALFVIDPTNLPFAMLLRPDPENLMLRACARKYIPQHDAKISGSFLNLLQLIDGDIDGDALFFSRDLNVTGNTEAVVCLRNAIDDMDGSLAETVADMFGPPARAALKMMRRNLDRKNNDLT